MLRPAAFAAVLVSVQLASAFHAGLPADEEKRVAALWYHLGEGPPTTTDDEDAAAAALRRLRSPSSS